MSGYRLIIDVFSLPENEREMGDHIDFLLHLLHEHTNDFFNALELFDFAESRIDTILQQDSSRNGDLRRVTGYQRVALRDAAITIWHFECCIDAIVKNIHQCPVFLSSIDYGRLKTVQPLFASHFPTATMMRNAVCHVIEFAKSPTRMRAHSYRGEIVVDGVMVLPAGSTLSVWMHVGRHLLMPNKGRLARVELSSEWLRRLSDVRNVTCESFRPMDVLHRSATGASGPTGTVGPHREPRLRRQHRAGGRSRIGII